MAELNEITRLIPHRPPFLWVDKIISSEASTIITEKHFPADHEVFTGHYPGNPITPGVLLCEAIFQSGALLMAQNSTGTTLGLVPVLTRINNAKFKRSVLPGDTASITVTIKEVISNVSILKGNLKVNGKSAVQVEFSCAMAPATES